MDTVAQPLTEVVSLLEQLNIKYTVTVTQPARKSFILDDNNLYVIKQQLDADGILNLMAAAKMRKEVF